MPSRSDRPALRLRVLTVNVHKGFSFLNRRFILPELRDAVRAVGADVVFLQEVVGAHERHARRHANWPAAPQYEYLADTLWQQHAYGRNAVYPWGHHGNAVLSRYPIVHHENRDVSIAGPERRGLLHCVLHVPERAMDVHAVCVHLGLQETHRHRQTHLLCELLRHDVPEQAPVVVAGDFNDWRLKAHRMLGQQARLQEVHGTAHGRPARTFPARWPLLRLDRIYVRNVSAPQALALHPRPWSHLSDHAPLAAEVQL